MVGIRTNITRLRSPLEAETSLSSRGTLPIAFRWERGQLTFLPHAGPFLLASSISLHARLSLVRINTFVYPNVANRNCWRKRGSGQDLHRCFLAISEARSLRADSKGEVVLWFQLLVGCRADLNQKTTSTCPPPANACALQVDYSSTESLASTLQSTGINTVISTIFVYDQATYESQLRLIEAASKAAVTTRFIASEFAARVVPE